MSTDTATAPSSQSSESSQPTATSESSKSKVTVNDVGTDEDFLSAVEKTIKYFNDGDIVPGVVVKVDRDEVLLDIGYKTEASSPLVSFRSSTTWTRPKWSRSATRSRPSSCRRRTRRVA
jgi:small subunit ribosomal protein S1